MGHNSHLEKLRHECHDHPKNVNVYIVHDPQLLDRMGNCDRALGEALAGHTIHRYVADRFSEQHIRETNLMERLAYLSTGDRIEAEELAFILSPGGQAPLVADLDRPLAEATDRFQSEYIRRQIEQSDGNMSLAATRLGLHRSNLYRKMRQLGMETS